MLRFRTSLLYIVIAGVLIAGISSAEIWVEWSEDLGYPETLDYNRIYPDLFVTGRYDASVLVINIGDENQTLEILINGDGEDYFTIEPRRFELQPQDEQVVTLTLQVPLDNPGEYTPELIVQSDDPDQREIRISLHAEATLWPVVGPINDPVEDNLFTGEIQEYVLTLENRGGGVLRWESDMEVIVEDPPEEELIAEFDDINAVNEYVNPAAFDWDNHRMWIANYNQGWARAYEFTPDYRHIEQVLEIRPGQCIDGTWLNGIYFTFEPNTAIIKRFDADGERLDDLETEFNVIGLASDTDRNLLFVMGLDNDNAIHVYSMTEDNMIDEEIGVIDNHLQFHHNLNYYGLEWVPYHDDGQLWMNAPNMRRTCQISVDTDNWECIEQVQTFDIVANNIWDGIAHDGFNMWVGGRDANTIRVYSDGINEHHWIDWEPKQGEIEPDGSQDIVITVDMTGAFGGDYSAELHIYTNDPESPDLVYQINITVFEPLRQDVEIRIPEEFINDDGQLDWNLAYLEVFAGAQYPIEMEFINVGNVDFEVDEISFDDENRVFSVDPVEFTIMPDESQVVTLTFEAEEAGNYPAAITILANVEDHPEITMGLIARAVNPPQIEVDPDPDGEDPDLDFEDFDLRFENGFELVTISNTGESDLRFRVSTDFDVDWRRDNAVRSARHIGESIAPHRDDPGDQLAEIQRINFANTHVHPTAYDSENQLMWVTNYSNSWARAYRFNDDYDLEQVLEINPGNCLDGTCINGIYYTNILGRPTITRWDSDGNRLQDINTNQLILGLAADNENELLFLQCDSQNEPIIVYRIDEDGGLGEHIDEIHNHYQFHANQRSLGLEWVEQHPDGQLWMTAANTGMVYQIAVDTDNWECTEEVQRFNVGISNIYDHVAHDGTNIWAGGYASNTIRVYDDGIIENRWIQLFEGDITQEDPDDWQAVRGIYELEQDDEWQMTVYVDSDRLGGGFYLADIHIETNDPDEPDLVLNAEISVWGPPALLDVFIDDDYMNDNGQLDWNLANRDVFAGVESSVTVQFVAFGGDDVEVERIFSEDDEHFTAEPDNFVARFNEPVEVTLTFSADEPGVYESRYRIISDAIGPDEDNSILVIARAVNPPQIEVDPEEIDDALDPDDGNPRYQVFIHNSARNGSGDLRWSVEIEALPQWDDDIWIWIDDEDQEGIVSPGENDEIIVNIEVGNIVFEAAAATIFIHSNDPSNMTVEIPVAIIVGWQPPPPQGENHSIIVTAVSYEDEPVRNGWHVGVFDPQGTLAGRTRWWGEDAGLVAWGDDPDTEADEGFEQGEPFAFRLYDPFTRTEHENVLIDFEDGPRNWVNEGFTILSLHGGEQQQLRVLLDEGWNLISLNIDPIEEMYSPNEDRGPDIIRMMAQLRVDEDLHRVFLMKDGAGNFYAPHIRDFNTIPYWHREQGYQIKIRQDLGTEATWSGRQIPCDDPITLQPGWNMVAYFPSYELPCSRFNNDPDDDRNLYAVREIKDVLRIIKDGQGNFAAISGPILFSNLFVCRPTQGYQVSIISDEPVVFHWSPELQDEEVNHVDPQLESEDLYWPSPIPTGSNMSLIVESIEGYKPAVGDQLAAVDYAGNIVGTGAVTESGVTGMAIWGDDPSTDYKDGLAQDEQFTIRLYSPELRDECDLMLKKVSEGTGLRYKTDGLSVVRLGTAQDAMPEEFGLTSIYPNPFNSSTLITFDLPENSHTIIEVTDIAGRQVAKLMNKDLTAGQHSVRFDAADISSGVYVIKMITPQTTAVRKAVMVK